MRIDRKYMKSAEFKARQGWLAFVDAAGIVLQALEPVKEAAWDWFRKWRREFRTPEVKKAVNKGLVFLDQFGLPVFSQPRLI